MADSSQLLIGRLLHLLLKLALYAAALFLLTSVSAVLVYRYAPVKLTPLMLIRDHQKKAEGEKPHCKQDWVGIEKMSPHIVTAAIAAEDRNFMSHDGFDFDAIKQAAERNKEGKPLAGGSTISQQTAKNVFLWPQRSWLRKGLETYFTVLIEIFWSKERIMEVYLNVAEWGDGIYGIEAAAHKYYHKTAYDLTLNQACWLSVMLPSPLTRDPLKPSKALRGHYKAVRKAALYIGKVDLKAEKHGGEADEKGNKKENRSRRIL